MNYKNWYTDTMDISRVDAVIVDGLTTHERVQVNKDVPCRIYRSNKAQLSMKQTAANIKQESYIMCAASVDVQAGDELHIHKGALLGQAVPVIRGFASEPEYYFEPFGAVIPGLAHQEILLMEQERM